MGNRLVAVCLLLVLLACPCFAQEEDKAVAKDAFTIELLYRYFESRYTPRDFLIMTQKRALYIAGEFGKSREEGLAAIDEFNRPFTRWNQLDGFHPQFNVNNNEKGSAVANPNFRLHKMRNVDGLLLKFKDHAGRLVGAEGFNRLKTRPNGAWFFQYSTFVKSETKVASPFFSLDVLVNVPGTKYHVQGAMPFKQHSLEEVELTVEYLDKMTPVWSIME